MPDTLTAKKLREERAKLVKCTRDVIDKADAEKRDLTAEERQQVDRVLGGVDAEGKRVIGEEERLKARIDQLERLETSERSLIDPAGGKDRFDPRAQDYNGRDAAKARKREEKRQQRKKDKQDFLSRNNGKMDAQDQALLLQAWMRVQEKRALKREHEWVCEKTGTNKRKLTKPEFVINLDKNYGRVRQQVQPYCTADLREATRHLYEARAAQSLNVNTAGGYLVPEGFVANLEIALLMYSNIRTVADVMRTASGQDLPWPAVNDTFQKGQILTENAQVTNVGKDVVFSNMVLHAYKYTSNLILIPVELLEDSAFDLASIMGQLLGIRIARIQNDHMTFGTGIAQPTGLLTGATQGVQAASPTALAWDDLYKLEHAVDPAYRAPGVNPRWMFHDQILGFLKRLKDGAGRYLWQAGVSSSVPDTIDGFGYTINQSMSPTMASGNKTVAFGALQKYKVRDVTQIRLRRLVERYADLDQEGYVMFTRFDSQLLDAGTHPVQFLVH